MKTICFSALCLLTALALQAEEHTSSSIKFSQPDQPGRVRIYVAQGSLNITTNDTPDTVTVSTEAELEKQQAEARPDGLRVLSNSNLSFSLTENGNVVELDYGRDGGPATPGAEFAITVPRNASIEVANSWGTEIHVADVAGDVEIKNMHGEIHLKNLSGGALIETMNGEIHASFAKVTEGRPLSFTTMNGEIELHLPADANANVRFRTQNGSILTDFDESVLKTKTENQRDTASSRSEAARIAGEAAREAARIAQEVADDIREVVNDSTGQKNGNAPKAPRPPRPPSIPSMVGGKVVSGVLNAGGTDIQAATMNGEIIVRRAKAAQESE